MQSGWERQAYSWATGEKVKSQRESCTPATLGVRPWCRRIWRVIERCDGDA